jgi:hypothetical protein
MIESVSYPRTICTANTETIGGKPVSAKGAIPLKTLRITEAVTLACSSERDPQSASERTSGERSELFNKRCVRPYFGVEQVTATHKQLCVQFAELHIAAQMCARERITCAARFIRRDSLLPKNVLVISARAPFLPRPRETSTYACRWNAGQRAST